MITFQLEIKNKNFSKWKYKMKLGLREIHKIFFVITLEIWTVKGQWLSVLFLANTHAHWN